MQRHSTLKLTLLQLSFALLSAAAAAPHAHAAGMRPETTVVVVDEANGETSMNIQNTDDHPALLYTTLQGIPEDDEDLLLVTPPVARVEAGQTQLVRFILHADTPLKTERLRRVIFDSIPPKNTTAGQRISVNVRQNLPVILHPAGLAQEATPWKHLEWRIQNGSLTVSNPSPYVVRLTPQATLQPAGEKLDLGRTYLLPGQTFTYPLASAHADAVTAVRMTPATTYGFAVEPYDAPLSQPSSH